MLSHCALSKQLQKVYMLKGKCYPSNAHFSPKQGSKVDCATVFRIICYSSAVICKSCMLVVTVAFQKFYFNLSGVSLLPFCFCFLNAASFHRKLG